jgi:hypothetical protein
LQRIKHQLSILHSTSAHHRSRCACALPGATLRGGGARKNKLFCFLLVVRLCAPRCNIQNIATLVLVSQDLGPEQRQAGRMRGREDLLEAALLVFCLGSAFLRTSLYLLLLNPQQRLHVRQPSLRHTDKKTTLHTPTTTCYNTATTCNNIMMPLQRGHSNECSHYVL